jgi:hypothetical protein
MDIKFKLKPPMPINFITVDTGIVGKKEDGFVELPKIPVGSLTEEQAQEYAELIKED